MTAGQLLARATQLLKTSTSPSLDVEVLLAYVLKLPRTVILSNINQPIKPMKIAYFYWLVWRRRRGSPIAYLVGFKEFYGRNFKVTQQTLIPRPTTELLIDKTLGIIRANDSIKTIADIGTGSGCIAITLAAEAPHIKVYATDISKYALTVTKHNARIHKVSDRVILGLGNLLEPLRNCKIDMVVANLPYVTKDEYEANPELKFEPKSALLEPAELLEKFCQQLSKHPEIKFVLLETSPQILENWLKILKKYYSPDTISIFPDLSGNSRLIMIDTNTSPNV